MSEDPIRPRKKVPPALVAVLLIVLAIVGLVIATHKPFPSDRTPEGAYLRIAHGLTDDKPETVFPYLETEAQWASYTVRDNRKRALDLVRRSYPEEEKVPLEKAYAHFANAPDGADVFALYARERGWDKRLKRDLSGVASVDREGERASVVTVRGTRYSFRRRDNGIWGLTIFTADLVAEAERTTRDLTVVEKAAADYEHAKR
jgi:hypothetical protein